MLTCILIDVANYIPQHGFPANLNALQFEFEELSVAAVFLVIDFGIGVEEQCKWFVGATVEVLFQTNQKMNMVVQDTICPGLSNRYNMCFVEFQEELNMNEQE